MRVLLSGIDSQVRDRVTSLMRELGHELRIVGTGLECLDALRDFVPDILVLERNLLWGGGDGVIARMSEEPELSEIPIILLEKKEEVGWGSTPGKVLGKMSVPFKLKDLLRFRRELQLAEPGTLVAAPKC